MHLLYSREHRGKCPRCEGDVALLTTSPVFDCDEESPFAEQLSDGVETGLEITCHWCPECRIVTSLAVNSEE